MTNLTNNVIDFIPPPDSNLQRTVSLTEDNDLKLLKELRSFLRKAPYPMADASAASPKGNLTLDFKSMTVRMHLSIYSHDAFSTNAALSINALCDDIRIKGYSPADLNLVSKIANFLTRRGYQLRTREIEITRNAEVSYIGLIWTPTMGYEHIHMGMFRLGDTL